MKCESKLVCVGVVSTPHGVRGDFKLKTFTENAESIFDYPKIFDDKGQELAIKRVGQSGGHLTAHIDGINDRNEAELLKGTKLYISRDALPKTEEGEFYIEDLIGLTVKIADGREVGVIRQVANYGAGDVVEVKFNNGTEEMFIFNDETFPNVEIEQGFVELNTPEVLEAKKP